VDKNIYSRLVNNLASHGAAVPADQNQLEKGIEIPSTTLTDMVTMMKKYVLPPQFDFVKYSDINPFALYIFEFEHTLGQDELTDIWQGITPQSALQMERGEVTIAHDINPYELFGNIRDQSALNTILGEMRFLVFKAKKRAKHNYYEITRDSTDDKRFDFTFQGDPTKAAIGIQGSYNWPYDFFSLVEKVKVEATYSLKNKDEE